MLPSFFDQCLTFP